MNSMLPLLAMLFASSANAAGGCPHSFGRFIEKFASDEQFQAERTRFPLVYLHVDQNDPYMRMKRVLVTRAELNEFERYPSLSSQAQMHVQRTVKSSGANRCIVRFRVPESDMYAIDFHFQNVKSDWRLLKIEDNSL